MIKNRKNGNTGNIVSAAVSAESKAKAESVMKLLMDEGIQSEGDVYNMVQVQTTIQNLESVPDLVGNSATRNRRWGAMFSVAVIPGLESIPQGPITLPSAPFVFYDADKLDELRARLVHEIDKAIETAKLSHEDPEAYMYLQEEFRKKLESRIPADV